ncbi:hypothetical protein SAMN05192561_1129 [Halopenitus malekzadehii]|uniref:Uncharacterized protein n=1 Tax=Halopenitus malekzadehii TaxID=1267564 RepID=A0A1H6JE69_9EURY|nr:hypothetical protein [Halopenitus malekzadehii]SEH60511.1 hypothetical protein SAMN05192561_1129 [Halopenitus malekzadehii]
MSRTKRSARRALKRAGHDVTLQNFEMTEADSRGEQWEELPEKTVTTISDPSGASLSYSWWGHDVEADHVYLIRSDIDDVDDRDSAGEGATRITDDGDTFVVVDADRSQQHGLYVLECERYDP